MRCRAPLVLIVSLWLTTAVRADWPHWRGPSRNDVIGENSGWKNGTWLPDEPAWSQRLGEGSSSPLVFGGRVFAMGWRDGKDVVSCLDSRSGKVMWQSSYDSPRYGRQATGDQGLYSGPSSTSELDVRTGLLYSLGCDGDLICWDTNRQGRKVWHLNLYDTYDVPRRPKVGRSGRRDYGYTSSPLIVGDWVIVEVGAREGNLMAFDRRDGKQVWTSQATNPPGHNGGPVLMQVADIPCVAVHNFDGLLVVRLDAGRAGRTLAEYPWKTDFANNIATPAVAGNNVVLTSHYNHQKTARLRVTLRGVEKVWECDEASKVCSPVIHDGHVYWAWRELVCLDFETGKVRWKGGRYGDPGSCIMTGDDRLVVWSNRGDLTLVESAARTSVHRPLASRRIGKTDAWPHVVLADGRLLCKDRSGLVVCFDLNGR